MLTGRGDEESAVTALKAGADNYVVKKSGYLESLPHLIEEEYRSTQNHSKRRTLELNVLYIEHNQTDVDLTIRHFKKHAHHINVSPILHVNDFYKLLKEKEKLTDYDVLLLDYRLPQDNALEVLKKVKESGWSKIPVILITGKGDEEIAVQALKIGAFDYITKNHGYLYKLPSAIENAYFSIRLEREHQALLESEQRYRCLFENDHTAMLVIDPESGKILDSNPAASRFYGWTKEELEGKSMGQINTLPRDELRKKVQAVANNEKSHFFFKHKLADGTVRDVEVYSGPVEIGGRPLLYSMIYDISERLKEQKEKEQLQQKLIQAQKMESFGQLAGGIAHDFNNILASIIGYTELTMDEVDNGSTASENLQEVYSAGIRAKELVNQILTFARQSDEKKHPVQIAGIASEVLKLIRSSTPANIEITQNFDTEAFVIGNAIQIHQIIMNLCTNAVHAMENDGGLLKIDLVDVSEQSAADFDRLGIDAGRHVKMTVADTGTGIPQEIIGSIFEPYFTTKDPGEGTGMGLAVVYGIVENYGGRITVQSELNRGTTFTIYLPVADECSTNQIYDPAPMARGDEKILFVDDEAPIAKLAARILGSLGYEVTQSTSSLEALELFQSRPDYYDLVITDMSMPVMTGDQLAEKLMKRRTDIPVIMLTGFSKRISKKTALEIGIKAFAYKPIVKETLARVVRKVLDENK
jgi:PAS domain S-box-containing protein